VLCGAASIVKQSLLVEAALGLAWVVADVAAYIIQVGTRSDDLIVIVTLPDLID
jgi:hypothetical protein